LTLGAAIKNKIK